MFAKIRKAVFPAAGLGTRFLPATKAQPKEMLSLVDKPLIQYGVEEAIPLRRAQHHYRDRARKICHRRSFRR
jgi:CTP:molybdopterin cytidylyltransferase MocA